MDFRGEPLIDTDLPFRAPDGTRVAARVTGGHVADLQDGWTGMIVRCDPLGDRFYVEADLFHCLIALRNEIEPQGWRVLCNGARQNGWPSGMLGQMSAGTKVYLLAGPRPRGLYEIVQTFDEAPEAEVVAVEEQTRFRDEFFARVARGG